MRLIKAIVVDSNTDVINQLSKFADENAIIIDVCGFCDNLKQSISFIKEHKPELIFLQPTADNLASFSLLKELDFNIPKFIFISDDLTNAYDAYKHNAVDFQKKPLDFNELIISIYKVIKLIEMEISFQNQKVNQIKSLSVENSDNGFIAISSSDKIELIKLEDIVYCKAEGKYTEFVLSNKQKILSSKNLGEYSSILISNYFFRIHHSYVVNVKQIIKITKKDGLYCEFAHGISLPVAKRRQEEFVKFIKL
ncbi:LytR/AlgR family response regulator transcription factor [Flavobacterium sp. UBA7663]|uniref:LytR/AlgR family response regulator transcription factor n=1 Tax=Flavobacterium sp. UBA7663 TaxID=1946557 RepID=UPI0025C0FC28|nr:LytTR family DNA-binding domain-containing protein [Flavobacterium sp. UBA7663]